MSLTGDMLPEDIELTRVSGGETSGSAVASIDGAGGRFLGASTSHSSHFPVIGKEFL